YAIISGQEFRNAQAEHEYANQQDRLWGSEIRDAFRDFQGQARAEIAQRELDKLDRENAVREDEIWDIEDKLLFSKIKDFILDRLTRAKILFGPGKKLNSIQLKKIKKNC
ncbi:MAG: hypothetical protein M1365_04750, partial [Actinobacteria bacterium]|nr:hypothetical protein [Actinomycetota bacterium]